MVRGTLNARRNPDAAGRSDRACIFTFIDDPGDNPGAGDAPLRRQYSSLSGCARFLSEVLRLPSDLASQLAASLEAGENSTVDVEIEEDVYRDRFAPERGS